MVQWRNPLNAEQLKKWEAIEAPSQSGVKIKGLYAKSPQQNPKATIVLGHPMGKEAKAYFLKTDYPDFLLDNGFNVVVFDMNGFGESECGSFAYYEDVLAIGHKTKELNKNLPIGYHGISLGGQWATLAFTNVNHPYDFAVVESAATTLDEFWVHFPVAHTMLKVLNLLMPRFRKHINMVERIKDAKHLSAILYIYSASDQWTPISMGKRFKDNTPMHAELWTVKDVKHAMIIKSEFADQYKAKLLEFFHNNLRDVSCP